MNVWCTPVFGAHCTVQHYIGWLDSTFCYSISANTFSPALVLASWYWNNCMKRTSVLPRPNKAILLNRCKNFMSRFVCSCVHLKGFFLFSSLIFGCSINAIPKLNLNDVVMLHRVETAIKRKIFKNTCFAKVYLKLNGCFRARKTYKARNICPTLNLISKQRAIANNVITNALCNLTNSNIGNNTKMSYLRARVVATILISAKIKL